MPDSTPRTWDQFDKWAQKLGEDHRYVFRGQARFEWDLDTSLARRFRGVVASDEWRRRELRMYQMFRDRMMKMCRGFCDDWHPLYVMSLMQHHGVPTRMLDLTSCPWIAAFFAVKDTCEDSAIFAIDTQSIDELHEDDDYEGWVGPTHIGGYLKSVKPDETVIVRPRPTHVRPAAQKSLFLVPGHIHQSPR